MILYNEALNPVLEVKRGFIIFFDDVDGDISINLVVSEPMFNHHYVGGVLINTALTQASSALVYRNDFDAYKAGEDEVRKIGSLYFCMEVVEKNKVRFFTNIDSAEAILGAGVLLMNQEIQYLDHDDPANIGEDIIDFKSFAVEALREQFFRDDLHVYPQDAAQTTRFKKRTAEEDHANEAEAILSNMFMDGQLAIVCDSKEEYEECVNELTEIGYFKDEMINPDGWEDVCKYIYCKLGTRFITSRHRLEPEIDGTVKYKDIKGKFF